MLVLSRRVNEKVLFPGLHTSVQVVEVKPGVVRLGIEAPRDVTIVREELQTALWEHPPRDSAPAEPCRGASSAGNDRLTEQGLETATIGLGLARLQLQAGHAEEAQATLDRLHIKLQQLRRRTAGSGGKGVKQAAPRHGGSFASDKDHQELLTCCPR